MPRVHRGQRTWLARFVRHYPLGAAAVLATVVLPSLPALAGYLAPYAPVANDFGAMFAAPSARHWFGTDAFGRDVLSRILYGARTALLVGFASSLVGATIGGIVGVTGAYCGRTVDPPIRRRVDGLSSFPIVSP